MFTVDFPLFSFLTIIYAVFVIIPFIIWYLRGLGWSSGPITRKAEIEEHYAKMEVLERHGEKPKEENRKYRFFGWFSYIPDEDDSHAKM